MYLTEKEILTRQQEQLFGIQKILKAANISLDDITSLIPGMVHLNKIHSLDLAYLDRQSREILGINNDEIISQGGRIIRTIVAPECLQQAKARFGHITFEDSTLVISHFQAIKGFNTAKEYEWFYSVKKQFDKEHILTISNPIQTLGPMQRQIEKIMEENLFIRKNLSRMNSLSPREKEIMKLIARGHKTRQIADMLYISHYTVSTHRKNIWHKLGINSYAELVQFARQFDLL